MNEAVTKLSSARSKLQHQLLEKEALVERQQSETEQLTLLQQRCASIEEQYNATKTELEIKIQNNQTLRSKNRELDAQLRAKTEQLETETQHNQTLCAKNHKLDDDTQ